MVDRECQNCGAPFQVQPYAVRSGKGNYCSHACRDSGRITHGATTGGRKTVEYATWRRMLTRCYNQNCADFKDYGGRGITVCDRWRVDFASFLTDMGLRPSPKHSIDRRDSSLGYEPDNCRWATAKEQANNRRRPTVRIEARGESLTIEEWARRLDMRRDTLKARLYCMPVERALFGKRRRSKPFEEVTDAA